MTNLLINPLSEAIRYEIKLIQGSQEWLDHRLKFDNGSELAMAMNLHPSASRNDLIRAKLSGNGLEYSDFVKNVVFPEGHRVEAIIRPIAEDLFEEDFYPKVFVYGRQSSSLDGINSSCKRMIEIKQFNAELFESVSNGTVPNYHMPQIQQGLMCSGAVDCIFIVANKDVDGFVYAIVERDEEFIETIPAIWIKFHEAAAEFTDIETVQFIAESESRENLLPVVTFQGGGIALQSNIKNWFAIRETKYEAVTKLVIDRENAAQFKAVADEFENGEGLIDEVLKRITTEATPVIDLIAELKGIKKYLAAGRIYCNKTVTDFRREIRQKACDDALITFNAYIDELDKKLEFYGIELTIDCPDFMKVCSRTKNNDSLSSAIGAELDRVKIEADTLCNSLLSKLEIFEVMADGYMQLFEDLASIIYKAEDDFKLLVESRVSVHKANLQAIADAKQKAEQEENDRIATNKMILTETELAKSMLKPVNVVFTVEQVRAEILRLYQMESSDISESESNAYQEYSSKLYDLAEKMESEAKLADEELNRKQALSASTDPDDIIRAEIADLRERAKSIYQSAQYCDNGTMRRAEESQAQSLNIQASKLEKELNERLSVDEVKAVAEIKNLSDSEFDSLIGATEGFDGEFVETDNFDGNGDSPAMAKVYTPPSKTGWDEPIQTKKTAIVQKTMPEYLSSVIPMQAGSCDVKEFPTMSKQRIRLIKAVKIEFSCSMGEAENMLIAEFGNEKSQA